MRRVAINNLGLAYDSGGMSVSDRMRTIQLGGRRVFGVGIANDSELDQCAVCVRSAGDPGLFAGALLAYDAFPTGSSRVQVVNTARADFAKVAVGAPWIGRLDVGALIVAATRGVAAIVQNSSAGPMLVLDLAESETEAIALAGRTRRAPLDVDFSGGIGDSGQYQFVMPTYGRSWWSLYMRFLNSTGTPSKSYILYGHTEPIVRLSTDQTPPGLGIPSIGLSVSTANGTGAVDVNIEADSSFDRMSLVLSVGAGGTGRYFGRFRAED